MFLRQFERISLKCPHWVAGEVRSNIKLAVGLLFQFRQPAAYVSRSLILNLLLLISGALPAQSMIGGKTYADGPFLIEDVEDQDLVCDALGRDWVPDYNGNKAILSAIDLPSSTLTPQVGQSPVGAFEVVPRAKFGFLNQGFGVPMPSQVGQSTLDFPGDITSFPALNFMACYEQAGLSDLRFQILLECYPENGDGSFPTIVWSCTPTAGVAFDRVSIDLSDPITINRNDTSLPLENLLAQTRFLFFFFSATVVGPDERLSFHIDDIELGEFQGVIQPFFHVKGWELYR